jgi:23S rRNA (cytosine1962-C5)-methyltransferase
MLNLFCYTSSFGVSAALGGARTTNVDLSAKALQKSRENYQENGLDLSEHRFFKEDALKFLARAARRGEQYDFIVLDPPSFSTVGKGTFSVKSGYAKAASDCFRVLAPGGRLLCVTNHTKTSPRAFRQMIEAAGTEAGCKIKTLKELKPGLDCPSHPEGPWPSKSLLVEID